MGYARCVHANWIELLADDGNINFYGFCCLRTFGKHRREHQSAQVSRKIFSPAAHYMRECEHVALTIVAVPLELLPTGK